MATYPIGPLSTIDPVQFYRPGCGLLAVVFGIFSQYVGFGCGDRNDTIRQAAASIRNPIPMTTFDKREEAFEKKFALDEEQKFKAMARRNKLLGLWAAEKLGIAGDAAGAYAREVVAAEFDGTADEGVMRKVLKDLTAKGGAVTEADISAKMSELLAVAVAQVKAGS